MLVDGQKFALICAQLAEGETDLPAFEILASVHALTKSPIAIGEPWTKWLGTESINVVQAGNFFVLASSNSANPSVLDGETGDLVHRASCAWWSILMCRLPRVQRLLLLRGGREDGVANIQDVGRLDLPLCAQLEYPSSIETEVLREAAAVARGLFEVSTGRNNFVRLRKGVKALRSVWHEIDGGERLHQALRSVEAVLSVGSGETKRKFKSRTELFVGPRHHETIGHLYDLRSQVEHMNEISLTASDLRAADLEELAAIRQFQAESLARHVYRRILSTPKLLAHFSSDQGIADFWSLTTREREAAWGETLDLDLGIGSCLALRSNIDREFSELRDRLS